MKVFVRSGSIRFWIINILSSIFLILLIFSSIFFMNFIRGSFTERIFYYLPIVIISPFCFSLLIIFIVFPLYKKNSKYYVVFDKKLIVISKDNKKNIETLSYFSSEDIVFKYYKKSLFFEFVISFFYILISIIFIGMGAYNDTFSNIYIFFEVDGEKKMLGLSKSEFKRFQELGYHVVKIDKKEIWDYTYI